MLDTFLTVFQITKQENVDAYELLRYAYLSKLFNVSMLLLASLLMYAVENILLSWRTHFNRRSSSHSTFYSYSKIEKTIT